MEYSKVPVGFGMALARNPVALNTYSAMTEEQREAILDQAQAAQSQQEMHDIINVLAGNWMH